MVWENDNDLFADMRCVTCFIFGEYLGVCGKGRRKRVLFLGVVFIKTRLSLMLGSEKMFFLSNKAVALG